MSVAMQGVLGCFIGCVILILMYLALYCYQENKFNKEIAAINRQYDKEKAGRLERGELEPPFGGGSFAFSVYRDLAKSEREQKQDKPDRLLGVMQDFFAELRERDKNP